MSAPGPQPLLICAVTVRRAVTRARELAYAHAGPTQVVWESVCDPSPPTLGLCAHAALGKLCPPQTRDVKLTVPAAELALKILSLRAPHPRAFILHLADTAPAAADMLLAVLESPPPNTLLILTARHRLEVPGPIQSRVRTEQLRYERPRIPDRVRTLAAQLIAAALRGDPAQLRACLQALRHQTESDPGTDAEVAQAVQAAAREALTSQHSVWTEPDAIPIAELWSPQGHRVASRILHASRSGASSITWLRAGLARSSVERRGAR